MPPEGPRVPAEEVGAAEALDRRRARRGRKASAFAPASYEPPLKPRRPELPPRRGRPRQSGRPDRRCLPGRAQAAAARSRSTTPRFSAAPTSTSIGLLPTPEELDAFLADQRPRQARAAGPRAARRRRRLRRALADVLERPAAQRLHRHRLHHRRPQADHRPGSTSRSSTNKPYDQFARELIAPPTPESRRLHQGHQAGAAK